MRWAVMVAVLVASAPAHADRQYVVQPGDTCLGIAINVVGDRSALKEIHRMNPQLGPLPHKLVPGQVLTVPGTAMPAGPDAHLTRARGDVKVRLPKASEWNAASRGMELFRAYRVGAAERASAELTFADDAQLGMRERTIVVIYGPEKRLAKVIAATAELERGTLETRLGELDGAPVVVRTSSAEADLRAGDVVVTANDGGPSVFSNHRGRAVEVRGRTKVASAVKVDAGMGSRVLPGKPPEPPRPLPPTPVWTTKPGPQLPNALGALVLAWGAVDRAVSYRLAITGADGDLIAATTITAPVVQAELALPAGSYRIAIAAFDADGFESAPSPPLAVELIAPTFLSPSGLAPGSAAGMPRIVAAGTTLVAPAGTACATDASGPPAERVVLDKPGPTSIHCTTAAGSTEPFVVEVAALQAREPASSFLAPVKPAWRGELGLYTGFHSLAVGHPLGIGMSLDAAHSYGDGLTGGLRVAFARGLGAVEGELGISQLGRVDADGSGTVASARILAALRHDDGFAVARLLAGVGMLSIAYDSTEDTRDNAFIFSWGGAAGIRVHGIELRADLRHELGRAQGGGVGHALQATLGASISWGSGLLAPGP